MKVSEELLWTIFQLIESAAEIHDLFSPKVLNMSTFGSVEYQKLKRYFLKKRRIKNFSRILNYLQRKKLVTVKEFHKKQTISLTPDGLRKIFPRVLQNKRLQKRKDGKYLMIIYDIPESKRNLRDFLRKNLTLLGYRKLQKSVWVSPYDVEKETESLILFYNLKNHIQLFLIEAIT